MAKKNTDSETTPQVAGEGAGGVTAAAVTIDTPTPEAVAARAAGESALAAEPAKRWRIEVTGEGGKIVQTIETDNVHAAHAAHGNGHAVADQLNGDKPYAQHLEEIEAARNKPAKRKG